MTEELNGPDRAARLEALARLAKSEEGRVPVDSAGEVNNHVHTIYSFSPYSPAAAVWEARKAGLRAVGSVDHDSISAAPETTAAGDILGFPTTVGYELRVHMDDTAVAGRKINNPDSANIIYFVTHGVPHNRIPDAEAFLDPLRARRNHRNRAQVAAMNEILSRAGVAAIDFDEEVVGISAYSDGGVVTERHILYALAATLVGQAREDGSLMTLLEGLDVRPAGRIAERVCDADNPHRIYDLLGLLKTDFLPRFFIQPDKAECISVFDAVAFARSIGAIPAYAYLGDVGESPTGDKKAEAFEDSFLDILFPELVRIGFQAITYMPPRNTKAQLLRVQDLCRRHGFMEISGVDINSSRQSFRCPEVLEPEFVHLTESTWALIAHEHLATRDAGLGLFTEGTRRRLPDLPSRIRHYAGLGRRIDFSRRTESIAALAEEVNRSTS